MAKVVPNVQAKTLLPLICANVQQDATVNTDEFRLYEQLSGLFKKHRVVNHSIKQYVNGDAHTNTAESFNALIKRGHYGIYHYMSPKHMHRYATEFAFRWTHRREDHVETVANGLSMGDGKTLTYRSLIADMFEASDRQDR